MADGVYDGPVSGRRGVEFALAVRDVVCSIPCGRVCSYGDVASLAGEPGRARLVGRILAAIGMDSDVPCHRVVNASGRPAPHWLNQSALLRAEGVVFRKNGCVDMSQSRWRPEQ